MIFLRSSIDKFVSSLARSVFWRKGEMDLVGPPRNIICFIHFLLVGDFSFIRGCKKHECTWFKMNRACFYCPLGLEIIGCSNKGLWIRPIFAYVDTISQYTSTHINASISLEEWFGLTFRWYLLLFLNIQSLGTSWYRFYLLMNPTRSAKSRSYLVLFVSKFLLGGSSWHIYTR